MADSSEAQWGVAAEDGSAPAEWAASGTLADAVAYANGLSGGATYIQLQSNVTADDRYFEPEQLHANRQQQRQRRHHVLWRHADHYRQQR